MAPGLQDLIPGLREAEDRYRQESAEAFAGVEPDIAGLVEILPFTPKMYVDLEGASCAFFRPGAQIFPEDIAVFLWRCSPHYQVGTDEARAIRQLFNANLFFVPYERAVADIQLYIRRAWSQMPLWKRKSGAARSIGTAQGGDGRLQGLGGEAHGRAAAGKGGARGGGRGRGHKELPWYQSVGARGGVARAAHCQGGAHWHGGARKQAGGQGR